jgi:polysaccharide export outer membrane protein
MRTPQTVARVKILASLMGCGLLASLLLSCSSKVAQLTPAPIHEEDVPSAYMIGPEDILEIVVWKNQTLSKVVTVLPDGKISLPLVGDIQAAGATAIQLKEEITERLKPYYREFPEVSVIVQQVNSHIYIIGEVPRPGRYVVKSGTTVLQAIALAGGLTQFASPNKIMLLRTENGVNNGRNRESIWQIRYRDIISGRNLETNITLKTGDTIIVH